jgi:CheY-like chemotaxis protein
MIGIDFISSEITCAEENIKKGVSSSESLLQMIAGLKPCLENIQNTNNFMIMTLNRCLDFARGSGGLALIPKLEMVNLKDAIQLPLRCMATLQLKFQIQLESVSDTVCSHVITDKHWLEENLLCFLSNAVKYSHEGEIVLSVVLEKKEDRSRADSEIEDEVVVVPDDRDDVSSFEEKDNDQSKITDLHASEGFLVFEVSDHGIGMTEEEMQSLFNPFKQNQKLGGGTGLGLYCLAKRIEALKGHYGVHKRDDGERGSVFWFSIPYHPDKVSAATAATQVATASSQSVSIGKIEKETPPAQMESFISIPIPPKEIGEDSKEPSLNILMAEDSLPVAKMMTGMLKRHGHTAAIAENGAIFVDIIKKDDNYHHYDLILMDIQMPVMDGLEATRQLREYERYLSSSSTHTNDGMAYHKLIIGISANSDEETIKEAFKAGVDAFLAKPFTISSLMETVEKVKHSQSSPSTVLS